MDDYMKIKKISASDQVCRVLQEQIASGKYKVGDKLPSENELADAFGVNRLTVRVAIQKLSAIGVVEVKQGSGSFVKQFDYEKYLTDASIFFEQSGTMENVCEFRAMLEITCAKMAMERATSVDFDELEALTFAHRDIWLNRLKDRDEWLKKAAAADLAIHEKICQMSHNPLCIYAFAVAKEAIYQYVLFCLFKFNPPEKKVSDIKSRRDVHYEIFQSIKNKDIDTCSKELNKMIYSYGVDPHSMPEIE